MVKNKNAGKPRNYALEGGVYRFGRSKMYHKKDAYKFLKKKAAKKAAPAKPTFVEKPIGGAKNGGTRMVRVKKLSTTTLPLMRHLRVLQRISLPSTNERSGQVWLLVLWQFYLPEFTKEGELSFSNSYPAVFC